VILMNMTPCTSHETRPALDRRREYERRVAPESVRRYCAKLLADALRRKQGAADHDVHADKQPARVRGGAPHDGNGVV